MALEFVIHDARKRKLRRVQDAAREIRANSYENKNKGKIIGDDPSFMQKPKKEAASESAPQEEPEQIELCWQNCKSRVQGNPHSVCRKFYSHCAKEKCPKKNIDV